MSIVSLYGAGSYGAAIAHRLAERGRCREILFIDDSVDVAAGKALDIQQSGPIGRFETRLAASSDPLSGSGAAVIVIADNASGTEWQGEPGLALVRKLAATGTKAPLVFAGPNQLWLMEAVHNELKMSAARIVGTAPAALVGAVAGLAALELGLSNVDVGISGRPPALVIGWSAATTPGALVVDRVPAHRLLAISRLLARLWPPGPQAVAAATAPVVEALLFGSRRAHHALTILDGEFGARGVAAMMPLELGQGRVLQRITPSLSPAELTDVKSGLTANSRR